MGNAIGIDLGTTNTAVAVLVDGRPRVLEDEKGYKVLPSCVSVKSDGRFVVGQAARNLAITAPDRTVYAVKRLVGRRFDSREVAAARKRVGYQIHPADDGLTEVEMAGERYSPTEISCLILQVAKGIAERALGEEVTDAVITVPAYFNHAQRAATLEAAKLAGLRCERLLNEPTAAALAYGFRKDIERTIVIYDLGGGTFDISVLKLSHGVYEVLATSGQTFLGGEDFDHKLVDHLAEDFLAANGVDPRQDVTSLQRLKEAAERAKCELSFTDRTTVLVPRITPTENLEVAVSRLTLEGLCEDLLAETLTITRRAVEDAGLGLDDIDDVILVGGQTRMPRVREAIGSLFEREPSRTVHPEEVVAIGAAVHASALVDPEMAAPLLLDVTPFDLGIDVAGGLFQSIIARNSRVPTAASRVFATANDNQEMVKVTARQGESRFSSENEFLGQFEMWGLTAAARMETKVEVTFKLDSNGMLHVAALEPLTGESRAITIRNYGEVASTGGAAVLEGDLSTGRPDGLADADQTSANGDAAAGNAGVQKKAGLLSRLFGGKKSRPPANAAAPTDAAPDAAGADSAVPDAPIIDGPPVAMSLPDPSALEPLDLDAGELVALEPMDFVDADDPVVEPPVPVPDWLEDIEELDEGVVGMADGEESMAMPRPADDPFATAGFEIGSGANLFGDDEDDDPFALPPDSPGSFSGNADPGSEEAFALPEDLDDEEELFELGEVGDFASLDDDAPVSAEQAEEDVFVVEDDEGEFATFDDEDDFASFADEDEDEDEDGEGVFVMADDDDAFALPDDESLPDLSLGAEAEALISQLEAEGDDDFDSVLDGFDIDSYQLPSDDSEEVERGGMPGDPGSEDVFVMPDEDAEDLFELPDDEVPVSGDGVEDFGDEDENTDVVGGDDDAGAAPARLRMSYPDSVSLAEEYRANLDRGGCFVSTAEPLTLGREVVIQVDAPGLSEPIQVAGVVAWSSIDADPTEGHPDGMGIEYLLGDAERQALELRLSSLGG